MRGSGDGEGRMPDTYSESELSPEGAQHSRHLGMAVESQVGIEKVIAQRRVTDPVGVEGEIEAVHGEPPEIDVAIFSGYRNRLTPNPVGLRFAPGWLGSGPQIAW